MTPSVVMSWMSEHGTRVEAEKKEKKFNPEHPMLRYLCTWLCSVVCQLRCH